MSSLVRRSNEWTVLFAINDSKEESDIIDALQKMAKFVFEEEQQKMTVYLAESSARLFIDQHTSGVVFNLSNLFQGAWLVTKHNNRFEDGVCFSQEDWYKISFESGRKVLRGSIDGEIERVLSLSVPNVSREYILPILSMKQNRRRLVFVATHQQTVRASIDTAQFENLVDRTRCKVRFLELRAQSALGINSPVFTAVLEKLKVEHQILNSNKATAGLTALAK